MTLSVLAAQQQELFDGFGMFGIVKETGVDDEGLVEFHEKYYPFPLYCDKSYSFYQALGDRKVSIGILMNPVSLITMACGAYQRITTKGIGGNVGKGEGLVQGGIIVFDTNGKPKYAYEEDTGHDLPVKDILAAISAVRRDSESDGQE